MRIYIEEGANVPYVKWVGDEVFQTIMNVLNAHGAERVINKLTARHRRGRAEVTCSHIFSRNNEAILNSLEAAGAEIIFICGIFETPEDFAMKVYLLENGRKE
jgi:hypothetical protein